MKVTPIWTPSEEQVKNANLTRFIKELGFGDMDYFDFHKLSVQSPEDFWTEVIAFCGAQGEFGEEVLSGDQMFGAKWFPNAQINFAQTMLRRKDTKNAIVFRGEDKVEIRLSFRELKAQVAQVQAFLREKGVVRGDRVAAFLPNHPSAIVGMIATASLGAIWTSCSPDFGHQGVVDRFGQVEPKVLFAVDGYYYNGKSHDCTAKVKSFLSDLPTVEQVIMVEYIETYQGDIENCSTFNALLEAPVGEIHFELVPFDHPLYILYSSGTTGAPKCIVHGHGGTLLQHLKEHQLHSDIRPDDRVFYFTTCSWMMWNWLASALASRAAIMLYDGSPFYPGPEVLWEYAETEKFTFFGTSAKYIEAVQKANYIPKVGRDLSALRGMASTGSPLSAEGYDFVYEAISDDIHLASISGGTDIVSCFVLGVPTIPVYRGEIQSPGLGMAVEVWSEDGKPVAGERGELVCTKPFPCAPVFFWKDKDNAKYKSAYYDRFEDVWAHGDFAEITGNNGVVIYGRSDATLNPGGVRIGTAEIYRQVDKVSAVQESIVIGQEWDGDVRVVLFVKMKEGETLTEDVQKEIKTIIRSECTPRHVPAKILEVADIPRTKSGKIVEIPVRDVVHGREVKNKEALANPEALELYRNRAELSS